MIPTTAFDPSFSDEQYNIATTVEWNYPHQVRGVAGSGKTTVLARNVAERLAQLDADPYRQRPRIAVVCYNRCLVPLIEERIRKFYFDLTGRELAAGRVLVIHFNGLLYHLSAESKTPGPLTYQRTYKGDSDYRARLYLQEIERLPALALSGHRFDTIYVDEGQDFSENEFKIILALMRLSPKGAKNLILFYDNAQNLYARKAPNWNSLGISFVGRTDVMKTCVRNPAPVLDLAINVLVGTQSTEKGRTGTRQFADLDTLRHNHLIDETTDGIRTHFAQRHSGETPEIASFTQVIDEQKWLTRHIDHLLANGMPAEEILIIAPKINSAERYAQALKLHSRQIQKFAHPHQKAEKDLPARRTGHVTITTPESAKGYDAQAIFVVGSHEFTAAEAKDRAAFYVACTRSKEQLFVSGIGGMGLLGEALRVRARLFPGVQERPLPPVVLTPLEVEREEHDLHRQIIDEGMQKLHKEKSEMESLCNYHNEYREFMDTQLEEALRENERLSLQIEQTIAEQADSFESQFPEPIDHLELLLTTLTILKPSYLVLKDKSLDPTKVFAILGEINAEIFSRPSVNVTKGKGWAEVRFSTGISDDGRIYYQKSKGPDGKRCVLVSLKKRQDHDINMLKKI